MMAEEMSTPIDPSASPIFCTNIPWMLMFGRSWKGEGRRERRERRERERVDIR
jgi:hypothetical protein